MTMMSDEPKSCDIPPPDETQPATPLAKKRVGFATRPREEVIANARKGAQAAQANGRCYRFTPEAARAAALKGVAVRKAKREAEQAAREAELSKDDKPAGDGA